MAVSAPRVPLDPALMKIPGTHGGIMGKRNSGRKPSPGIPANPPSKPRGNLEARIAAWDEIKSVRSFGSNIKMGERGGNAYATYRRPGSQKK